MSTDAARVRERRVGVVARGAGLVGCALAVLAACSVGAGEGELSGSLLIRDCGIDLPMYALRPTFFGADYVTDLGADGREEGGLAIRVQRGSYRESFSDGLFVSVHDVDGLARDHLGEAIPILPPESAEPHLVDLTFYAEETCPSGHPDEFWRIPAVFRAVAGTITFHSVHAPNLDAAAADTEIHAELADVEFEAANRATDRRATLSGFFRFFHQRGAPAQIFP